MPSNLYKGWKPTKQNHDLLKEADFQINVDNYNQIISGVTKIVRASRFLCNKGIYKGLRFVVFYIWIYFRCSSIYRHRISFGCGYFSCAFKAS